MLIHEATPVVMWRSRGYQPQPAPGLEHETGGFMQRRTLSNDLSRRRRRWRMAKVHHQVAQETLDVTGAVSVDLLTDSPEPSGKG